MLLLNRKAEFWANFENSITEIISLALDYLKDESTLPKNEGELNRKFYFCLVTANFELNKKSKGRESAPFYESLNQPKEAEQFRNERENKRPDFQWSITDTTEKDPVKSSKQFVLECKRLRNPYKGRNFNENYVEYGIRRFIARGHGYGFSVESSAMLGYVQGMTISDILNEINQNLDKIVQEKLNPKEGNEGVHRFNHTLSRKFPEESFRLEHFWVDISEI